MTTDECQNIITERLGKWALRLHGEHATPAILIGLGHDHQCGEFVLCTTEDGFTDAQLARLLRWVANQLDAPKGTPTLH